jgi:hypothetical protein
MKFFVKLMKTATETFSLLHEVYGEDPLVKEVPKQNKGCGKRG